MRKTRSGGGRSLLARATALIVLLVLAAVVAGHVLGVPVVLSYAESDSMEPTIERGDGFLVVPSQVSGSVTSGDVIVYDAQEIEEGELTTHRVVDETDAGYITRGDANVVTDQDGAEPPVTDGQVVATAAQLDGDVVTIPHLGTAVMGIDSGLESAQHSLASTAGSEALFDSDGLATLLLTVGVVALALAAFLERRASGRERTRRRSRDGVFDARTAVVGLAVVLCLVSAGTMVAMSETTEAGIVSAEFESDAPHVIPTGETEEHTYELRNDGALPVVAILEPTSEGVEVDADPQTIRHGDVVNESVAITAPPETGYYLRSFGEYRYFAVFPAPAIAGLHAVHPWVAMAAVTGVLVALFVVPFAVLLGTGTIRTRSRRRVGRRGGLLRRFL